MSVTLNIIIIMSLVYKNYCYISSNVLFHGRVYFGGFLFVRGIVNCAMINQQDAVYFPFSLHLYANHNKEMNYTLYLHHDNKNRFSRHCLDFRAHVHDIISNKYHLISNFTLSTILRNTNDSMLSRERAYYSLVHVQIFVLVVS